MPVKKAAKTKKSLKILIYGPSGAGKTHFGLFATPGKTLVYDISGGTELFEGRVDFDYWTDECGYKAQSYNELSKCVDFLKSPEGRSGYQTFVLDSVTNVWAVLRKDCEDLSGNGNRFFDTRNTKDIAKEMYCRFMGEISELPQNVILIAREKPIVFQEQGQEVDTGEVTFEGEADTIYSVDLAFRLWVGKAKIKRYARIEKDRSGRYNVGHIIENPTFSLFNRAVNNMSEIFEANNHETENNHLMFGGQDCQDFEAAVFDESYVEAVGNLLSDEEEYEAVGNVIYDNLDEWEVKENSHNELNHTASQNENSGESEAELEQNMLNELALKTQVGPMQPEGSRFMDEMNNTDENLFENEDCQDFCEEEILVESKNCCDLIIMFQCKVTKCEAELFCDVTDKLGKEIRKSCDLEQLTKIIDLTEKFLVASAAKENAIAAVINSCSKQVKKVKCPCECDECDEE